MKLLRRVRTTVRRIPQPLRWILVLTVGVLVALAGVALLPLPGPGSVVILLGLAILAIEFPWARRWLKMAKDFVIALLDRTKKTLRRWWRKVKSRSD